MLPFYLEHCARGHRPRRAEFSKALLNKSYRRRERLALGSQGIYVRLNVDRPAFDIIDCDPLHTLLLDLVNLTFRIVTYSAADESG